MLVGQALRTGTLTAPPDGPVSREISRVTVTEDEYRESLVAQSAPERFAEMFLGMFRAGHRGDFATDDPTLERLIGHPPTAIRGALTVEASGQAH